MSQAAAKAGPPRRRRAPRGQGQRLREEILDAAEQLLRQTGDQEAVSVKAVADAVGVSPPAIYLHFADKLELIFAVCQRHFATLDVVLREAAAGAGDPLESLRRRGRAYVQFGIDHPEEYRILFMMRPTASPPDWQYGRLLESPLYLDLLDVVQAGLDDGVISPEPAPLIAFTLWASVHGLTSLLIAKPDLFLPHRGAMVDYLLNTLVAGISPAGGSPKGYK